MIYHTWSNNCIMGATEGIYAAAGYKSVLWHGRFWRNWRWLTRVTSESNPRAVVAQLEKQGLIAKGGRWPNFEEQFSHRYQCVDYLKKSS